MDREETTRHRSIPHDSGMLALTDVLTDEEATALADHALQIEAHFGTPQDIEWTLTDSGKIIFLQSRPLASPSAAIEDDSAASSEIEDVPLLQGGTMAALGQACGPAYCVNVDHPLQQVPRSPGDQRDAALPCSGS